MLLCAITDRQLLGRHLATQRDGLLQLARIWAENGVALVQLREKDLPPQELISLAQAIQQAIRTVGSDTRLILNAPLAVVLAAGASGIHLPADATMQQFDTAPSLSVRTALSPSIGQKDLQHLWVSVACHTLGQVKLARNGKADCILFAPIFEKQISSISQESSSTSQKVLPGVGLELLAAACKLAHPVPVLALGGVTAHNAADCIAAGASGIAAIRLFHGEPSCWKPLISD